MKHEYLFTFVIPAYNCADYINEAIESVLEQDIGFLDNIQLVIVDDGSTDDTGEICRAYCEIAPENIFYIYQHNAGVNAARAKGLENAKGAYINFLDADDKWSDFVCSYVVSFFNSFPDVAFCAAKHMFFEAKSGNHQLNYKYKADGIIDVLSIHDYPQLSVNNAFIKREFLKSSLFDTQLSIGEDALAINLILLDCPRYGVMQKPNYWYRQRLDKGSAISNSTTNLSYYIDTPLYCHKRLFEESKIKYGTVLPFLQYSVMYESQWRIKDKIDHPLSPQQLENYRQIMLDLLSDIDNEIILAQKNMGRDQKLYALAMKHGITYVDAQKHLSMLGGAVFWQRDDISQRIRCWNIDGYENKVTIEFMTVEHGILKLEGRLSTIFPRSRVSVMARTDSRIYTADLFPRYDRESSSFFENKYTFVTGFQLTMPAESLTFDIRIDDCPLIPVVDWGRYTHHSKRKRAYTKHGKIFVMQGKTPNKLTIEQHDNVWYTKREILYESANLGNKTARRAFPYRHNAISHLNDQEKIWLISDRVNMAGDNGEALFTYLCTNPISGVVPYFVISKYSNDYRRLKKIGNVVDFRSNKHRRLHLRADAIISSAADSFIFDCFGNMQPFVTNLEHYKFIFLQHGITQNDLSKWLNRYNKNISLIVTASPREAEAFLSNPAYAYSPEVIAQTGFPRHDKLIKLNETIPTEKRIIIAPTWRQQIAGKIDKQSGEREENQDFESTDYFQFYNKLINDAKLGKEASRLGFSIALLIHPAFAQEAHKFSSNYASIQTAYDYPVEFSTSSVLVTDYSSVAFDFALLQKQIIYTQSDFADFYAHHPWDQGYFDYERDGFGPVCKDYSSTVDAIVEAMHNSGPKQEYIDRANSFFFWPQESRCKLVTEAILALDGNKNEYHFGSNNNR